MPNAGAGGGEQVRLLLLDFAKIRNADGHARYVRWRNGRGE